MNQNSDHRETNYPAGDPQTSGAPSTRAASEGPDESLWSDGQSIWWTKVKAAMKSSKVRALAVALGLALVMLAGFWSWNLTQKSEKVEESADLLAEPPPPLMVTVPAGTRLTIRLAETLASTENSKGDSFRGKVAHKVEIDGHEAIPAGSPVRGRVLDVLKTKKRQLFKGDSITLSLRSLEVRSKTHTMTTDPMKIQARSKEFFVKMAKDAVVGAVVGQQVDGAGGAIIGAGVQAGTALILQGKRIRFEPGQRFEFELSENVTVSVPRPIPLVLPQVVSSSSGSSGFWGLGMWLGLFVHSLLVVAAIFFVRQQVLLGVWAGPTKFLALKMFRNKLYVAHGLLAILGLLFVGWAWVIGGVLAMLFDRLAYWGLGMYVMLKPAPGRHPSMAQPSMQPNQPSPWHPPAGYPPASHPPVGYPLASYPPTGYPPHGHSPSYQPATHPAATHPAATHPAATHPAATHPAATHPAATHPAATHPAATHPSTNNPSATEPPASQSSFRSTQTPDEPQNPPMHFGEPSVPWREKGDWSDGVAEASLNSEVNKDQQ